MVISLKKKHSQTVRDYLKNEDLGREKKFICNLKVKYCLNITKHIKWIKCSTHNRNKRISLIRNYKLFGRQSELRKSERRKPKRTPKTMQAITTSKRIIKAIRTSKSDFSERRKANYHNVEKKRTSKVIICLKTTFDVVIILNAIGKIRTSK